MSYPPLRSLNAELTMGAGDGKYRRDAVNRSGMVEDTTLRSRKDLDGTWYGNRDEMHYDGQVRPDGIHAHQRGRARYSR
jgi:hypothetical protein